MPFAVAGLAMTAASTANSLANSGGGATGTYGGNPGTYIPTAQPGFDQYAQQLVGSQMPYATQMPSLFMPYVQQGLTNISSNPYAVSALGGADTAYNASWQAVAPWEFGGGGQLYGAASGALPYSSRILTEGFDPQDALYNRDVGKLTDQINAQLGANNQLGTPAGAGIMAGALSDFNLNWRDRALARENAGIQGFGNLMRGAGGGFGEASALGRAGMDTLYQGAQLPYAAYLGQQNDISRSVAGLENLATGAFGVPNQAINNIYPYLRLGQTANSNAIYGQGQGFNQMASLGSGFGSALGQAQDAFGSPSTWFSGGTPGPGQAGGSGAYDPNTGYFVG